MCYSGRLSYSVGGSEFSVPLLPDTITVKPNPSLVVHYFHEKFVRGDDPMTPEIEPVIPFSLAVLVMNSGYGVARALKITSGQPEIIENEKGLLIAFKIIGAQLGNKPILPSLAVDFGDIPSFTTKTARWLMTSSLAGTFYNYSATFENINPLGDPQLSLMDELGYHELIKLVRIEIEGKDDELDDFLVNNVIDQESLPDKLYNSANGSDIADVHIENITNVHREVVALNNKHYVHVRMSLYANASVWFYCRIENNFTSSNPSDNQHLLYVESHDGRALLVDKNIWQTTHILNTFFLHILDFIPTNNTLPKTQRQQFEYRLVFGPRNIYAPKFNKTNDYVSVPYSAPIGYVVLTLHAYDLDGDSLSFALLNQSRTPFKIRKNSNMAAELVVGDTSLNLGLAFFQCIVEDAGVPPKSSTTNITVLVTEENTTMTPVSSTSGKESTTFFHSTSTNATITESTISSSSTVFFTSSLVSISTKSVSVTSNGQENTTVTSSSSTTSAIYFSTVFFLVTFLYLLANIWY